MSAEVFISYATSDRDRVLDLVERLRNAGVTVWIDQAGIDVSSMWSQEIVSAIKGCKVMLLSISPHSTESENVVKELALASERKKPIIPVYLQVAEIPETMEYQLAGIQRVEYFKENEDAAFKAMLRSLVNRGVHVDQETSGASHNLIAETPLSPHNSEPQKATVSRYNKIGILIPILLLTIAGLVSILLFQSGNENANLGEQTSNSKNSNFIQQNEAKNSIAIVPFRNIGAESENNFLAEGMHEEINAMLSMAPNLMVKDGSRFKEQINDVKTVGQSLEVESILTGSVMQSNGKLRVIVKLVDAKTEANLWTKTFDKNEGDFFTIQREIAQSVAEGLSINLDSEYKVLIAKRQTKNLEAYNLYLEARLLWNTRIKNKMYQAIEKYELALVKDPQFALGHVGIAECYNMIGGYGFSPPSIAYPKAKRALEQALNINENISEAHSSLGWYYYAYEYDYDKAETSLLKALSLNPSSPEANRWYAQVRAVRFKTESLKEIKKAIKLEPKSAITRFVQVRILTTFKKLDEAIEAAEKVKELDLQYIMWPYCKIEILYLQGKYEEALSLSEEAIKNFNDPMYYGIKGFILGELNRKEEALSVIETLEKMSSERNIRNQYIYMIYYSIGDYDSALNSLNEDFEKNLFNTFIFDPRLYWVKLHDNEKFKKIFLNFSLPLKPL
ncbi:TIR domain-containing protein [Verrucomicrobia bacterium]|nr:TIR domain-containing protein [Verrucomicrobiota bacterium]